MGHVRVVHKHPASTTREHDPPLDMLMHRNSPSTAQLAAHTRRVLAQTVIRSCAIQVVVLEQPG